MQAWPKLKKAGLAAHTEKGGRFLLKNYHLNEKEIATNGISMKS